jgi:hypothetical protein
MGGACTTYMRDEKFNYNILVRKREDLEDLDFPHEGIILKWLLVE